MMKPSGLCFAIVWAVLAAGSGASHAAALSVCNIADGGAGDLDGLPGVANGIVRPNVCALGANGAFVGTAREVILNNYDAILFSGDFTGATGGQVAFASNAYNFNGGAGFIFAFFNGNLSLLQGQGRSVGGEFFDLTGSANTFNNNAVVANFPEAGFPRPLPAGQQMPPGWLVLDNNDIVNGVFGAGPGALTLSLDFNAGAGQRFRFNSDHGVQAAQTVPEPGTIPLLSLACLAGIATIRHRRRALRTEQQ